MKVKNNHSLSMKKYVSRHWDTKIELKKQWFLSLIRASDMFIKTIKTIERIHTLNCDYPYIYKIMIYNKDK